MFILDFSQWGYYSGNGGNTFQLQKIGGIQKPGYYWALITMPVAEPGRCRSSGT